MKDDKPAFSVRVTPGNAEDPVQKFKDNLKMLRETMEENIELNKMTAKLMRTKYDALIREGFRPEEALFLCK